MKIGIDCRLWGETGVGRYIRNLVYNLQKIDRKNEYVLFVLTKDYENLKSQMENVKWKIVKADIRWHTLEEQLKLPSILNQEKLDLVHFPYFSVPVFYNKPFVVTIHDLIIDHFPTGKASTRLPIIYGIKRLGYKYIIKKAAQNAEKIITVSNATKQEIVDYLKIDEEKVVITHEGIDDKIQNSNIEIQNNTINTKYKILNTKYFLYVGNAYPHKNLERLLEAFGTLAYRVKLILVGKEDYFYKRLKNKVAEMRLSEKVIFLQNVTDEELSSLYQNALALVMPSLMEGFGLPALEAMVNKCLVLASDIPALREVCGDAAIYFNPYGVNDIFKKMSEAYYDDTYHYSDRKEKGLERVKNFSWHKMAKETLRIYESCVGV